jgi:hypothetical protein
VGLTLRHESAFSSGFEAFKGKLEAVRKLEAILNCLDAANCNGFTHKTGKSGENEGCSEP